MTLGCAALAVASLIVAVNLWRERSGEAANSVQVRAELAQVASRSTAIAPSRQSLPVDAPVGAADGPASTTAAEPAAGFPRTQQPQIDPAQREALARALVIVQASYPGLAEELGLNAAEHEELIRLLAQLQIDRGLLHGAPEDPVKMAEYDSRTEEYRQRMRDAVTALLGADKAARFQVYQQSQLGHLGAAQLDQSLRAAGMPLTTSQKRALIDIINAQPHPTQNLSGPELRLRMRAVATDPLARARMNEENREWARRVLDSARFHLSAEQVELLQQELQGG